MPLRQPTRKQWLRWLLFQAAGRLLNLFRLGRTGPGRHPRGVTATTLNFDLLPAALIDGDNIHAGLWLARAADQVSMRIAGNQREQVSR